MKYSVVGNDNYLITDKKEIERKDGKPIGLKIKNGKVTIDIYGYIKNLDIEWLYWLSYFKLEMPKGYEERVFDLEFKDFFSLKHMRRDPKMVIFKKPVYLKSSDNYRLIARFPNYAVATNGTTYNIKNDSYHKSLVTTKYYITSAINDQAGLYKNPRQMTHRLVAITWIENKDYEKFYLVDHKDGDKTNCHYTNLKWTDHKGNNQDKVYQGLSSQAIAIKIRDIETGVVKTFPSLGTACKYMNRSPMDTKATPLRKDKIWDSSKGRFEIKYANDTTPWYFTDKSKIYGKNQKVHIRITKEDGSILVATSLPSLLAVAFDGKKVADTINKAVEVFNKRYPKDTIEVTYLDQYVKEISYIAKNTKTNETFTTTSRKELSSKTNVSKSSVQKSIVTNGAYHFNNWVFKLNNDKPFSKILNNETTNQPSIIKALDTTNNDILTFDSKTKASNHFKIDRKTLSNIISEQNLLYNKYLINVESA